MKILLRSFFFVLMGLYVSAQTTNTAVNDSALCERFSRQVLNAMQTSQADLLDFYIELADYNSFIDENYPNDAERDALKLEALENYKQFRKDFRKECRRITKVFSAFERSGGTITYSSCMIKHNKENYNIAIITCFYKTQLKKESALDSVSFEVIYLNDTFHIIDGFFDELSKVEERGRNR